MNNVQLIGRLTATPELKQTKSGVSITRFTVAVDKRYQKQGEDRKADFISCIAWRQTAEFICKYFTKGRRIGITGSITTGSYEASDGHKVYTTDIDVDNAEFVDSVDAANTSQSTARSTASSTVENVIDSAGDGEVDDSNPDLPF